MDQKCIQCNKIFIPAPKVCSDFCNTIEGKRSCELSNEIRKILCKKCAITNILHLLEESNQGKTHAET